MATTTNYGWTTPDDTDLVKDGAAAIRTLGSSVDTTTKALNPSTTEGDIEYRSSTANTNSRLAIGTAGQVLQVNAGATAPEWTTLAAAGSITLLSTTTLSGATTTISGIDQGYESLIVVIQGVTGSGFDSDLRLGLNGAFSGQRVVSWVTGSMTSSGTTGSTATNMGNNVNRANTNPNNNWTVRIPFYSSTTIRKVVGFNAYWTSASGELAAAMGTLTNNSTSAVTSLAVSQNGSTTFTAGTCLIYGVK